MIIAVETQILKKLIICVNIKQLNSKILQDKIRYNNMFIMEELCFLSVDDYSVASYLSHSLLLQKSLAKVTTRNGNFNVSKILDIAINYKI